MYINKPKFDKKGIPTTSSLNRMNWMDLQHFAWNNYGIVKADFIKLIRERAYQEYETTHNLKQYTVYEY